MTCISVGWIARWFNAYSMENVAMLLRVTFYSSRREIADVLGHVICRFAGESINVILLQPLWSLSPTVCTEFRVIELFVLMEYLLVSRNVQSVWWWIFTVTMTLGKVSVFLLALFWVIVINLNPDADQWFLALALYSCLKWQQYQVKSLQTHVSCLWKCAWPCSRLCMCQLSP